MAVENKNSVLITNANTGVKSSALLDRGGVYSASGTVEVASDGSATSTYRFARVPSQASIMSILLLNDALTGGTSYQIGLYESIDGGGPATNSAGNTTGSAALFATGVTLASARTAPAEMRYNNSDINTIGKPIAELLGFTSGNGKAYYDVVVTAVTPSTVAGTISLEVRYGGF